MAAKTHQEPRAVDVAKLQGELRQQGLELDLHFGPEAYTDEQEEKFEGWFSKLHDIYGYEDQW